MLFGFSPRKLWRRRVKKALPLNPPPPETREEELRRTVRKIKNNIALYGYYGLTTLVSEEKRSLRHYERLLATEVQK